MQPVKTNSKYTFLICAFIFFAAFLLTGLFIYDDFGPVSEERNQIDAGHIIWAYITGDNSHYTDLPDLESYFNRYYGQGGTFITVLFEALSGFTWDVNRIWKVRRLWNFFCFFLADIGLFSLIKKRYGSSIPAFLAAMNLILLPRMFPEVFYNDRDPLFLSWLIFFFCVMMLFLKQTNLLTALLLGCTAAVTVSVRMFGFILVIPLILTFVRYPGKRRFLLFAMIIFFLTWYAISPIAWKDPFSVIRTAIVHLTTKQRILDTRGSSLLLFAGKYYPEQDLPWFYLPLWMLISTPLVLIFLSAFGFIIRIRNHSRQFPDGYEIIDLSLGSFFVIFMIGIPLIRPTLYSGWRHFYFLNLSLVWFAVIALERILRSRNKLLRYVFLPAECLSLGLALFWIVTAHPYEGIYYSPLFRRTAPDNFERDTGYISTMECLEYLAGNSPDQKIEVMNANAFIPYSLIGLPKPVRERFTAIDWKIQRIPMKYIIFNYNNMKGNSMEFPYYAPVYSIRRIGTKLAEIFQRTNNNLLDAYNVVASIHASVNDTRTDFLLSDDPTEMWQGADTHSPDETIIIELKDGMRLDSLEVFPGEYAAPSETLRFFASKDGKNGWEEVPAEKTGTNGWTLGLSSPRYLQIRSDDDSGQPWQIRQILFYGSF